MVTLPNALIGEVCGWTEGTLAQQTAQHWSQILHLEPPISTKSIEQDYSSQVLLSPAATVRIGIGSNTFGFPTECVLTFTPVDCPPPFSFIRFSIGSYGVFTGIKEKVISGF